MLPQDEETAIPLPIAEAPAAEAPRRPVSALSVRSSSHKDHHARLKLGELSARVKELKEVLSKKPQLEQEHANLSKEIDTERTLVRERERSLAIDLANIDRELADSRNRLARLQGREAAALQRVSAPLALETSWAKEAAECCGSYEIVATTLVSPRADLLKPDATEVVDLLQPGMWVDVVESLRLPDGTVRARITKPSGWIYLLDQVGARCAICREVDGVDAKDVSAQPSLIQDGISSRSAALRGWTARVDLQKSILCEKLHSCFDAAAIHDSSAVGPYILQPFSVTPLARLLSTEAISRTASSKAAEANSDLSRLDAERASMELADAESSVMSLFQKVRLAASRNKNMEMITSRLHNFLQKAKSANQGGAPPGPFGLLEHWAARSKENFSLEQVEQPPALLQQGLPIPEEKENLPPPAAAAVLSDEVDACEGEAREAQVRIDTMLRTVTELQRQRGERMQEICDLRQKLSVLRAAAGVTTSGRQLGAVQSRLRRIQDVVTKMAGSALDEIDNVEAWTSEVEETRSQVVAGLMMEDAPTRPTEEEVLAVLQDLQQQFRPGQSEDCDSQLSGSQSLWWLAANIAAINAYVQVESAELGPAAEVDKRREFYALADSRFAKEMKHYDDWGDNL